MVTFAPDMLDRTFAALAHPIRRSILTRLAEDGSASVGELAAPFEVTLMAISKHLKVMEGAGLVVRKKDGRVHRMRLDPEPMERASEWIEKHRAFWEQQLDGLARYLESATDESQE
jgi:DNA-binding transcriptional ArsR family regulator